MSGTRGADALPRERCVGSGAPVVQLSVFSDANEDHGWVYCRAEDTEQMHRMMAHIVHYVRDVELQVVDPAVSDEEERARVLSDPLEVCPERADNPEYYEQILCPTSLSAITHRLVHCEYAQPALFEQDVLQLFSNARQWYGIGSEGYADMATLQRLYHELTPSRERLTDASGTRHIKARASDIDVVTAQRAQAHAEHRFASSAYGPGQEPPSDSLVSQPQLVEVAYFKGRAYHVGDWVHIMNPVDASRPIVGQLARLYKKARTPGTFFTACWYYRPEQTHHAESRLFGEREVLQTGVYGEHALEDILEDVLVLYIDTYRRARPAVPYWTPEIPVYYVESKYDVHRHEFHRIRDWAACVPSAVRDKTTPMDVFPQPAPAPTCHVSLLAQGVSVAGGALVPETQVDETREWVDLFDSAPPTVPYPAPVRGHAVALPRPAPGLPSAPTERLRAYAAFHAVASDIAARLRPEAYAELQRELQSRPQATDTDLRALAVKIGGLSETQVFHLRDTALAAGMLPGAPVETVAAPSVSAVLVTHRQGAVLAPLDDSTRMYTD